MRNSIVLLFIIACAGNQLIFGQGVNNITIQPSNPTATDTVFVISDFSYYGNCAVGLVNEDIIQSGNLINIYPEYCGFGGSTICNTIDTFSLGVLLIGNYIVNIEYHQGTSCAGSFDAIIANTDTTFEIGTLSTGSIISLENEISIYPNPTSDFITLQSAEYIEVIKLFDMTGKEIQVSIYDGRIGLLSLCSGVYVLSIQLKNGEVVTNKIIKK